MELRPETNQYEPRTSSKLGCLFWFVAVFIPIVGLVWAIMLPRHHTRKRVAIIVPALILIFTMVLFCSLDSLRQETSRDQSVVLRPATNEALGKSVSSVPRSAPPTLVKADSKGVFERFSQEERRDIWEERIRAARKATYDAGQKYPSNALIDTLRSGYRLVLQNAVNLMPTPDPGSGEKMWSAIRKLRSLSSGTTIVVERDSVSSAESLWYKVRVEAGDAAGSEGWVIASSFLAQLAEENWDQFLDLDWQLRQEYLDALAEKYDLNHEQLDSLSMEAARNNWPLPPVD